MQIIRINNKKHIILLSDPKNNNNNNKAIFFDRDGVLIKDMNYIKKEEDVFLLKGVNELLSLSRRFGYLNIVITNQSGIARNFFTWEEYEKITFKMLEMIDSPDAINAIYANGEYPNDLPFEESWRKPNPNMILKAAKDFKIDLSNSILIGDRLSDIKSGEEAGIGTSIHLLTGHGFDERSKVNELYKKKNKVFNVELIDDLSSFKAEEFLK